MMQLVQLQASLVTLGLCALVCTCTYASSAKQLTDYVDSRWLDDKYSNQKYLIAELIEAQKSDEVFSSGQLIIKLHDQLQSIHDGLHSNKSPGLAKHYSHNDDDDTDREWSSLGPYEHEFNALMAQLEPRVAAAQFERQKREMNSDWFDQLRDYLLALKMIVRFDDYGCLERNYKYYAQTISTIYGQDLDSFLAGESKLYPKLQAFLLHYGRRALSACVACGFVLGDALEPERTLDDILSKYGKFKAAELQFKLLDLAKEFDFVDGKFDSKKMLASCPMLDELVRDGKTVTFDQFYAQLQPMCALYKRDIINNSLVGSLASLLIPGIDLQSGLRWSLRASKLKEYERIYFKFCSASREKVAANFDSNKPQSKCKKFLCALAP